MTNIVLTELPYINDVNADTAIQFPLGWIKNGEPLTGSTMIYGSDGILNRVSNQLQQNIVTLDNNNILMVDAINNISTNVDNINLTLGNTDISISSRVNALEIDNTAMNNNISLNTTNIVAANTNINSVISDIGAYDSNLDSVYRTVRNDLLYIKTQIGNYTGQDNNSQLVDNNSATGMKLRLETLAQAVNNNSNSISSLQYTNNEYSNRITALEERVQDLLKGTNNV